MIVTHAPTQSIYKFSAVFVGKKNLEVRSEVLVLTFICHHCMRHLAWQALYKNAPL